MSRDPYLLQARYLDELPAPAGEALDVAAAMGERGGDVWVDDALAFIAERPVHHLAQSRATVDVGAWIGQVQIWVFACADALLLGAWGGLSPAPKPFECVVSYPSLTTYLFSDVTWDLLLRSSEHRDLPALGFEPLDGYQFVAQIQKGMA